MKNKYPDELLPRWQKILLILQELSGGTKKQLKFEDIVVGAFKRFPETFHLRGYREYPDSGDLIHKPLYDMRKNGLLNAKQKTFSLTDKGIRSASILSKTVSHGGEAHFKPDRGMAKEIERILSSDSFLFFKSGNREKILDTDFLQYFGVSVHTSKNEFLNRMETINYAIKQSPNFYPKKVSGELQKYHRFMVEKFGQIIQEISKRKERNF